MKIQISGNKISHRIRTLLVYLLLLFTSGFHLYSKGYHIPVMLVAALILYMLSNKRIDVKLLITAMLLVVIMIISGLLNNEKIRNIIVPSMDILCSMMIALAALGMEDRNNFIQMIRKVLLVIAIGSLIMFFFGVVANNALKIFPKFTQGRHTAFFTGISFVYQNRQYLSQRNMGLFWEPGAFQTYLILAMIFEDCLNQKGKIRNLLIYTVAMVTTFSTTGLVCLLLFWILYVLKDESKKISVLIGLLVLLACFVIILNSEMLPQQLQFSIVEKLRDLFSGDQELRTVRTRMDSIVYPLEAFSQNPLFGVSKGGMSAWRSVVGHGLNTCTPINWFAHYGFFMGIILLTGFGKFFVKISTKKWIGIAFLLIFLISISTEAFNYNPTLLCFAFMGISMRKELLPEVSTNEDPAD